MNLSGDAQQTVCYSVDTFGSSFSRRHRSDRVSVVVAGTFPREGGWWSLHLHMKMFTVFGVTTLDAVTFLISSSSCAVVCSFSLPTVTQDQQIVSLFSLHTQIMFYTGATTHQFKTLFINETRLGVIQETRIGRSSKPMFAFSFLSQAGG